jgi:hypothetical protein
MCIIRNFKVFTIDFQKSRSLKIRSQLPRPVHSIGPMMFHLKKVSSNEKITGNVVNASRWSRYGETIK